MYIIDADYNIISYNQAMKRIYPGLKKGEKCYKCLMDQDQRCEACPVVNGIEGPKNYLEPGTNLLRSVDAMEVELKSGEIGHAIVFSAAEATEDIYRGMTSNGETPLLLGIINVLGKDCWLYLVVHFSFGLNQNCYLQYLWHLWSITVDG